VQHGYPDERRDEPAGHHEAVPSASVLRANPQAVRLVSDPAREWFTMRLDDRSRAALAR
jgi:hypothetical protein